MAKVIANYENAMNNAEEDLDDHHDAMRISHRIEKTVDRKEDAVDGITTKTNVSSDTDAPKKTTVRKIKKKLVINQYSPIIESTIVTDAESQQPPPPPPLPSDVITFKKHKK
jgi:sugar-specific transcriptional regulator TrmB